MLIYPDLGIDYRVVVASQFYILRGDTFNSQLSIKKKANGQWPHVILQTPTLVTAQQF